MKRSFEGRGCRNIPSLRGRTCSLPEAIPNILTEIASLWLFSPSGTLLLTADGLTRPRAMAFAPDGTLLVAEGAPARVRRFAFEGVPASSRE